MDRDIYRILVRKHLIDADTVAHVPIRSDTRSLMRGCGCLFKRYITKMLLYSSYRTDTFHSLNN